MKKEKSLCQSARLKVFNSLVSSSLLYLKFSTQMEVEPRDFSLTAWVSAWPRRIFSVGPTRFSKAFPWWGFQYGRYPYPETLFPQLIGLACFRCLHGNHQGAVWSCDRTLHSEILTNTIVPLLGVTWLLLVGIHNVDLLRVIFYPLPIIFICSPIVYMLVAKNNLIHTSPRPGLFSSQLCQWPEHPYLTNATMGWRHGVVFCFVLFFFQHEYKWKGCWECGFGDETGLGQVT